MPLTVFGANLIITIICILWFFSGEYSSKFKQITNSKFILASIVFFSLHVVGLLWTEDLRWGLHIIHKMWYFLILLPVLFTIVQKEYIKLYISAFLVAISFSEIVSYLIWFEVISPFKYAADASNPTPFMSHISYNPILAFAIYLVGYELLFSPNISVLKKYIFSFFMLTMSFNMFITGGRAGQVMFFAVIAILIFQYFKYKKFKAILLIFIVCTSIFYTAFQTSNLFNKRVMDTVINIQNYESNKNTSVGQRISYVANSWKVIVKNPIIGIGTGDFVTEYNKINRIYTPEVSETTNPHNMYILILMQIGLIGLVSFLSIFYYQIKWSYYSKNKFFKDVGLTLPTLFLLIMWSDSYLLGHYTTLMYIFFSSFLYKDYGHS